ncbi:uncharacterized protein PAN0_019c5871 [Moesziomyces antarcticus]|uniref:Uncharacterized protein n=2 Tax=Pseudozyma antarctica TaxID=84753 RepID=A0A081CLU7_PSEA2|nr:uncharacterized protein PAN0_019c5871 [Moesziomyces antarcticus]GAK67643.1 hypothetical protein PAN0_019c5871 [Moesziomyces antarcticus]SPO48914.1 uncharacterized protein PSANT_06605 [Moesziomyces antarcticus]
MAPGSVSDRFGSHTGFPLLDAHICSLMYAFEQVFSVPAGRATALLFISVLAPLLLNVLYSARTRFETFKAFAFATTTQLITVAMTTALFYPPTPPVIVQQRPKFSPKHSSYKNSSEHSHVSVNSNYVRLVTLLVATAMCACLGIFFGNTANDHAYYFTHHLFELYPLFLLPALLIAPAERIEESASDHDAGVRLIISNFLAVKWLLMAAWWAGVFGFFIRPMYPSDGASGSRADYLSPVLLAIRNGDWSWTLPSASTIGLGPRFLLGNLAATIIGLWAAQIEQGHPPNMLEAVLAGPGAALATSFARTWQEALNLKTRPAALGLMKGFIAFKPQEGREERGASQASRSLALGQRAASGSSTPATSLSSLPLEQRAARVRPHSQRA